MLLFFFSSRRRHTRSLRDWSSDVCSSDLAWLEKRREAFLEATVKDPYFWYSVSVTAGMLLMMAAYTKLYLDHRRSRSEERRVGKECRSRWVREDDKKKERCEVSDPKTLSV